MIKACQVASEGTPIQVPILRQNELIGNARQTLMQ